ncbi:MAG TPA: rhodanese-like domain-containing protein [Myxococcales bacterium]
MAFSPDDVGANREFFAAKLRAEAEKQSVINWVKKEPRAHEIVLLDTRARDAFAKAHIEGAISVPLDELKQLAGQLPRDKTLVVYCWNQY